jgi:hypothetical protein
VRTGLDHDANIAQVLAAKAERHAADVHHVRAARPAVLVKAAGTLVTQGMKRAASDEQPPARSVCVKASSTQEVQGVAQAAVRMSLERCR